ncbi:hypothetical protein pEaSNUABM5_00253 [Erwinia phage pEa_SNUABM_5]|uniref:Uncharacterized protein n=1 Tax=Erwinia phage pEa_SNUABM_5 TaxID=2797313 RepID=A0A7T8EPN4_9CAUD|nr:hypothetical protein MPK73_gp253 [Erwinia phage pEa_SNUABM_5]QQO90395.1 hypothetical protein pEaSNUABM5_00253 [Erwinia phage pEa_SNUABM_5]
MAETKFYQEIHQATIETNFSIGVTRKHLTSQLEKLIETKNGKLPHYGFSFEEFGSFVGDKYTPNPDMDLRQQAMAGCTQVMCHFMWSFSKGSFEPEQELKEHIIKSDPPKVLPCAMLRQLPSWSQWIDCDVAVDITENGVIEQTLSLTGFWATYCNVGGRLNLCLTALGLYYPKGDHNSEDDDAHSQVARVSCMFEIEEDRPLEDTCLVDAFFMSAKGNHGLYDDHPEFEPISNMIKRWAKQSVNILVFVASEIDSLPAENRTGIVPRRKGKHYRLATVTKERRWTVGQEFLTPIREYEEALRTMTVAQKRAAHIRRGHYHSFWRGPRDGQRELFSKWLPPCVVRGTLAD